MLYRVTHLHEYDEEVILAHNNGRSVESMHDEIDSKAKTDMIADALYAK